MPSLFDPNYPHMASPGATLRRLRGDRALALRAARDVAADPSHTGRPGWPNHALVTRHEAALAIIDRAISAVEGLTDA